MRRRRLFAQLFFMPLLVGLISAPKAYGQTPAFRAVWADVFHNGYRNASQITTMVNDLVRGRYNAIFIEVLAYMDQGSTNGHGAFWLSDTSQVPRNGFVTGSFDPLADLCTKAHAAGIEVHAWIFPYRISTSWPPTGNPVLTAHPEWCMVPIADIGTGPSPLYGGSSYMLDFGSSDVQEYLLSMVKDLVRNYPIDGMHWDYEIGGGEYSDGMGYPASLTYTNSGMARYNRIYGTSGTPSNTNSNWSNFRRRAVDELMKRTQAEMTWIRTNPRRPLRHSASTMGYGSPPGSCTFTGEEAYLYFHDWPRQLQKGWLDTAIPMNYKVGLIQSYKDWITRSLSCWEYNRKIFSGLGAYLNTKADTVAQLQYTFSAGMTGITTYSYAVPSTDGGDWWSYVSDPGTGIFTSTAPVPSMPWKDPALATEGMLWGRVTDAATGEPVDDATVQVSGQAAEKTDGNGFYVLGAVPMSPASARSTNFSITVTKTGLTTGTHSSAKVLAGDIVRYDFALGSQPPQMQLTASSFAHSAQSGAPIPSDTFTVNALGTPTRGPVNYSASDNATWLSISPPNGTTGDPGSTTVTVSYNTAGLSVGDYAATITIADAKAINSPQTIAVALSIVPAPVPGDMDGDYDVDQVDFGAFQKCMTGPFLGPPGAGCSLADVDGDNDVDTTDFDKFFGCVSGPGVIGNSNCAD